MKVQNNPEITLKIRDSVLAVLENEKCSPETGLTSLAAAFMDISYAFAIVRGKEPTAFVAQTLNTLINQVNNIQVK